MKEKGGKKANEADKPITIKQIKCICVYKWEILRKAVKRLKALFSASAKAFVK